MGDGARAAALLVQVHEAANLLARLVLACWPLWLASCLLWVVLAFVGQAHELLRVALGQMHSTCSSPWPWP